MPEFQKKTVAREHAFILAERVHLSSIIIFTEIIIELYRGCEIKFSKSGKFILNFLFFPVEIKGFKYNVYIPDIFLQDLYKHAD